MTVWFATVHENSALPCFSPYTPCPKTCTCGCRCFTVSKNICSKLCDTVWLLYKCDIQNVYCHVCALAYQCSATTHIRTMSIVWFTSNMTPTKCRPLLTTVSCPTAISRNFMNSLCRRLCWHSVCKWSCGQCLWVVMWTVFVGGHLDCVCSWLCGQCL